MSFQSRARAIADLVSSLDLHFLLVSSSSSSRSPTSTPRALSVIQTLHTHSYGNAVSSIKGNTTGLYDTSTSALGQNKGLRQFYRFGLYRKLSSSIVAAFSPCRNVCSTTLNARGLWLPKGWRQGCLQLDHLRLPHGPHGGFALGHP